ncbi:hypothetical protein LAV73_08510 [Lysinibacillus xylanilyticus]|uniref:hypothetical protein n=1 Tax=Lysinibacillus xylanilyticus TaxID=582475 RepID=UPI002B2445CA|nr:hypothetical protein [Lysinibacillus xylanilyticus]MEB2280044.1 hypothetical protein [Lysinibacillus xylanilyticus]
MEKVSEQAFTAILNNYPEMEFNILTHVINEIIEKQEEVNIIIISFNLNIEDIKQYFRNCIKQNIFSENIISTLNIYQMKSIDINEMQNYKSNEEDIFIILGGEKTCNVVEDTPIYFGNKSQNEAFKFFLPDQLDIKKGIKDFHTWFERNSSHGKMIVIFETIKKKMDQILEEFKTSDLEIVAFTSQIDESYYDYIKEAFVTIATRKLSDSLSYIETLKEKISNENYIFLKFLSYLDNGYKENALKIASENYKILSDEQIILYANVLNSSHFYSEAYNILLPVFSKNKLVPGLLKEMLISTKFMDESKRKKFIEENNEYLGKEVFLMQECANFYSSIKEYKLAGIYNRSIYNLIKDPYFDLIARICEIKDNPPKDVNSAEAYLYSLRGSVEDNELYYRTAMVCRDVYNSLYKFNENLKLITLDYDFEFSNKVVNERLRLLQDDTLVEQALKLKPYAKERDLTELIKKRIDVLVEGLEYLFLEDHAYINLQEFLDHSQSETKWYKSISYRLEKELIKWNNTTLDGVHDILNEPKVISVDGKKINLNNLVELSQELKYKDILLDEKEDFLRHSIIIASSNTDDLCENLLRYETSLIMSYAGEYQKSNDFSISILNKSVRKQDINEKKFLLSLGLSSWGISQYKLGRKIEGIICIIVSINISLELKKYYAISDGLTILFLFFNNDLKGHPTLKNLFVEFREKYIRKFNIGVDYDLFEVEKLMTLKKWDQAKALLEQMLNSRELTNINDATNAVNYINTCLALNEKEKANNFLRSNIWCIINLFEQRLDNRWKVIGQFAELLFKRLLVDDNDSDNSYYNDLILAKEILSIAMGDLEIQRSKMFHLQERLHFTEQTKRVVSLYIDITMILYNLKETPIIKKHEFEIELVSTIFKYSSRAIAEKKSENIYVPNKDLELKAERYFSLYDELLNLNIDIESPEYAEKTREFEKIQVELLSEHPNFKKMPIVESISIEAIQKVLIDEVFFQLYLTEVSLITITITADSFKISSAFIDVDEFKQTLVDLGEKLSASEDVEIQGKMYVNTLCLKLTKILYGDLVEVINQGIKNIIVCQDMEIPFFTPSLMCTKDGWTIKKIDSLINIVSPNEFANRISKNNLYIKTKYISIGSKKATKDFAISKALDWTKSNREKFNMVIEDFGDNSEYLLEILDKENVDLFTFIAHGVEDAEVSQKVSGAIKVLGPHKRYISIDELKMISSKVKSVFLLTCRSGQPIDDYQKGESVWKAIVIQNSNAVLCRWDVSVNSGLIVLEEIIDKNTETLSSSVINAQRKLLASNDYCSPSYWACFEVWGI